MTAAKITPTLRNQLRMLATLCDANGGDTRLSRKPAKLIAMGLAEQTREGRSGHAGKGSRYRITAAGRKALANRIV